VASPDAVRSREDSLAGPDGRGLVPESEEQLTVLADLPDHQLASDAELLAALHRRDVLAFVEVYQRTAPAAHAVARRLLTRTAHVEAAMCSVYATLWLQPPTDGSLVRWARRRCFAVASADLRRRGDAPGQPSLATVLDDLPVAANHHLGTTEAVLARLSEATRRAVVYAHDAGVASADQPDEDAAALLEAGLLAIAEPEADWDTSTPSGLDGIADWALGLLDGPRAAAVASAIAGDASLSARASALRLARRRLEGLPASPATSQRIIAHVVAAPDAAEVAAPTPVALPRRQHRRAVSLVAASLALVLMAGAMALSSRAPVDEAVAQSRAAGAAGQQEPSGPREAVAPRRPGTSPRQPDTQRIVRPARGSQEAPPSAPPVRVTVPKMQVDERLVGLSVLNDGTLAAPEDFDAPGWYREGVAPGDAGPAVIVGHVDSMDGPAVFFKLSTLKPGDKAHITRADGTAVTFVIDRVERYAKDDFPTQQVYGPTPTPQLRLITCGGAFDNTTRSYDDNVIAFAHLQQPRTRASKTDEPSAKRDSVGTYDHLGRLRTPRADEDRARRNGVRAQEAEGA
jgi:hypothetical protein